MSGMADSSAEPKELSPDARPRSSQSSGTESEEQKPSTALTNPPQDVEANPLTKATSEPEYPPRRIANIVMFPNFLVMFLVALDRTIIATAIPQITDQFNSLADVGWYGSAYLITACGFQLIFGRIYTFFDTKWVYLSSIFIFELGSLLCGVAPNSTTLIVGRAVAGMGSCGIMAGGIMLIVKVLPLAKRPAYMGLFGAVFGVASVTGPLLGGVFTDRLSWRWCFYINIPCGGVVVAVILLFLKVPSAPALKSLTMKEKFMRLDPIGSVIFFPSIVCLLLALQYGGTKWAWGSARIIILLVLFVLGMIAFIAIQIWRQEFATVPPRIITSSRSVVASCLYGFFNDSSMTIFVYFIPVWFQAIKSASAEKSGIMILPLVIALVVASMLGGFCTKKVGYYTPLLYPAVVLQAVGAGLISTWTPTTNHSMWIGYQVIFGLGLGMGMQQPGMAMQTVLARIDVPTGISILFFWRMLGGAIFVSVGNNIFDNRLAQNIAAAAIPRVSPDLVTHTGATDLRKNIPAVDIPAVIAAYNGALRQCFYVGVVLSCMTIFGAALMEWKSIKVSEAQRVGGGKPSKPTKEVATEEKIEEKV